MAAVPASRLTLGLYALSSSHTGHRTRRHPEILKMVSGKPEPASDPPLASLLVYDPATWRGSAPREYLAEYFRSQQVRVLSPLGSVLSI